MESLKVGLTKSLGSSTSLRPDGRDVAETVARVLEGDREAFRYLVEEHYPAVVGLSRRLLGSRPSEAEDVAQETFLNAYRYLPTLQDPHRFSSWLFQIARSACRDRRRRWGAEQRAMQERVEWVRRRALRIGGEAGRGSENGTGAGDEVSAALGDLPAEEREALSLRYFDGLSYEEIAARLKLSFSQVDHLIRKARARVARRLAVRHRVESP